MPKLAANISWLYAEHALMDRFQAAADDGFAAVEMLFPYDHRAEDLARVREAAGVTQALINMPPGDWAAGERGLGALPGRQDAFRANVARAIEYADALGCARLHAMAGVPAQDAGADALTAVFCDNLAFAADAARAYGLTVLIEPINTHDIPGYFLTRQAQAMAVIGAVGAPNLKLQMDLYHCQIMDGDPAPLIEANMAAIGHFQVAGVPDRHEPDAGDLDYARLFALIDRLGFDGFVGCEYAPRASTSEGLAWARPWLSAA